MLSPASLLGYADPQYDMADNNDYYQQMTPTDRSASSSSTAMPSSSLGTVPSSNLFRIDDDVNVNNDEQHLQQPMINIDTGDADHTYSAGSNVSSPSSLAASSLAAFNLVVPDSSIDTSHTVESPNRKDKLAAMSQSSLLSSLLRASSAASASNLSNPASASSSAASSRRNSTSSASGIPVPAPRKPLSTASSRAAAVAADAAARRASKTSVTAAPAGGAMSLKLTPMSSRVRTGAPPTAASAAAASSIATQSRSGSLALIIPTSPTHPPAVPFSAVSPNSTIASLRSQLQQTRGALEQVVSEKENINYRYVKFQQDVSEMVHGGAAAGERREEEKEQSNPQRVTISAPASLPQSSASSSAPSASLPTSSAAGGGSVPPKFQLVQSYHRLTQDLARLTFALRENEAHMDSTSSLLSGSLASAQSSGLAGSEVSAATASLNRELERLEDEHSRIEQLMAQGEREKTALGKQISESGLGAGGAGNGDLATPVASSLAHTFASLPSFNSAQSTQPPTPTSLYSLPTTQPPSQPPTQPPTPTFQFTQPPTPTTQTMHFTQLHLHPHQHLLQPNPFQSAQALSHAHAQTQPPTPMHAESAELVRLRRQNESLMAENQRLGLSQSHAQAQQQNMHESSFFAADEREREHEQYERERDALREEAAASIAAVHAIQLRELESQLQLRAISEKDDALQHRAVNAYLQQQASKSQSEADALRAQLRGLTDAAAATVVPPAPVVNDVQNMIALGRTSPEVGAVTRASLMEHARRPPPPAAPVVVEPANNIMNSLSSALRMTSPASPVRAPRSVAGPDASPLNPSLFATVLHDAIASPTKSAAAPLSQARYNAFAAQPQHNLMQRYTQAESAALVDLTSAPEAQQHGPAGAGSKSKQNLGASMNDSDAEEEAQSRIISAFMSEHRAPSSYEPFADADSAPDFTVPLSSPYSTYPTPPPAATPLSPLMFSLSQFNLLNTQQVPVPTPAPLPPTAIAQPVFAPAPALPIAIDIHALKREQNEIAREQEKSAQMAQIMELNQQNQAHIAMLMESDKLQKQMNHQLQMDAQSKLGYAQYYRGPMQAPSDDKSAGVTPPASTNALSASYPSSQQRAAHPLSSSHSAAAPFGSPSINIPSAQSTPAHNQSFTARTMAELDNMQRHTTSDEFIHAPSTLSYAQNKIALQQQQFANNIAHQQLLHQNMPQYANQQQQLQSQQMQQQPNQQQHQPHPLSQQPHPLSQQQHQHHQHQQPHQDHQQHQHQPHQDHQHQQQHHPLSQQQHSQHPQHPQPHPQHPQHHQHQQNPHSSPSAPHNQYHHPLSSSSSAPHSSPTPPIPTSFVIPPTAEELIFEQNQHVLAQLNKQIDDIQRTKEANRSNHQSHQSHHSQPQHSPSHQSQPQHSQPNQQQSNQQQQPMNNNNQMQRDQQQQKNELYQRQQQQQLKFQQDQNEAKAKLDQQQQDEQDEYMQQQKHQQNEKDEYMQQKQHQQQHQHHLQQLASQNQNQNQNHNYNHNQQNGQNQQSNQNQQNHNQHQNHNQQQRPNQQHNQNNNQQQNQNNNQQQNQRQQPNLNNNQQQNQPQQQSRPMPSPQQQPRDAPVSSDQQQSSNEPRYDIRDDTYDDDDDDSDQYQSQQQPPMPSPPPQSKIPNRTQPTPSSSPQQHAAASPQQHAPAPHHRTDDAMSFDEFVDGAAPSQHQQPSHSRHQSPHMHPSPNMSASMSKAEYQATLSRPAPMMSSMPLSASHNAGPQQQTLSQQAQAIAQAQQQKYSVAAPSRAFSVPRRVGPPAPGQVSQAAPQGTPYPNHLYTNPHASNPQRGYVVQIVDSATTPAASGDVATFNRQRRETDRQRQEKRSSADLHRRRQSQLEALLQLQSEENGPQITSRPKAAQMGQPPAPAAAARGRAKSKGQAQTQAPLQQPSGFMSQQQTIKRKVVDSRVSYSLANESPAYAEYNQSNGARGDEDEYVDRFAANGNSNAAPSGATPRDGALRRAPSASASALAAQAARAADTDSRFDITSSYHPQFAGISSASASAHSPQKLQRGAGGAGGAGGGAPSAMAMHAQARGGAQVQPTMMLQPEIESQSLNRSSSISRSSMSMTSSTFPTAASSSSYQPSSSYSISSHMDGRPSLAPSASQYAADRSNPIASPVAAPAPAPSVAPVVHNIGGGSTRFSLREPGGGIAKDPNQSPFATGADALAALDVARQRYRSQQQPY